MSKLIKFAQKFPQSHPKAGLSTGFVEQILNGLLVNSDSLDYFDKLCQLNAKAISSGKLTQNDLRVFIYSLSIYKAGFKSHTIRNGNRFKVGDFFTPTVWSDKPYRSPQIIFWDDLEVKHCQDIIMHQTYEVYIDKSFYGSVGSKNFTTLAQNDGLSQIDMRDWFSKLPFEGQIICWDGNVKY
jgi:hypothetical protein